MSPYVLKVSLNENILFFIMKTTFYSVFAGNLFNSIGIHADKCYHICIKFAKNFIINS